MPGDASTRRVCQDRGVRVVTLGDLLLDVVVRLEAPPATDDDVPAAIALVPGGQAANVAAWVCWLGGEARLIARRTDDSAGRLIAAEIERLGVELAGPAHRGRAHRHRGRPGRARRDSHARERPRRRRRARAGRRRRGMLEGAGVLHVAGYTLLRESGAEAALRLAEAARRYGARVTVDLSTAHGIAQLGRDEMRRRVLALTPDVVFANEAEAAAFGEPLDVRVGRQARRARAAPSSRATSARATPASTSSASSTRRAPATPSRRATCSSASRAPPPSAARRPRRAASRASGRCRERSAARLARGRRCARAASARRLPRDDARRPRLPAGRGPRRRGLARRRPCAPRAPCRPRSAFSTASSSSG